MPLRISRDFANAGSIGVAQAQGGRSWPDQDVLPFGSLTIPGLFLEHLVSQDHVVIRL